MLPSILIGVATNPKVIDLVAGAIQTGIDHAIKRPSVPLAPKSDRDAQVIASTITNVAIDQLQRSPEFINATNSERFWQSRIFWAQVLGWVVPLIGGAVGVEFTDYDIQLITNVAIASGAIISSVGTLWARFGTKGKPPLFTGAR